VWGDHYPGDEIIAAQTARNRSALLYVIDVGGCPYRAAGYTKQNCGALYDDFEINRGWQLNPYGTDTAGSGRWQVARPIVVYYSGVPTQLGTGTSGSKVLVTGAATGGAASANDIDGTTTVRSAPVDVPANPGALTFNWYLAHRANSTSADSLRAYIEDEAGVRVQVFAATGKAAVVAAAWKAATVGITQWAGHKIRIVFTATDGGGDSIVEAAVDDLRIRQP
jgi:hypothetical protein